MIGKITTYLKEILNKFLKKKIISNSLEYLLYILLFISIVYSTFHLSVEIISKFIIPIEDKEFPFILVYSEDLFIYFLPIFILFGILKYFQFDLREFLFGEKSNDKKGAEELNHSKELFISSILSYVTIKSIKLLFFNNYNEVKEPLKYDNLQLVSIGVFLFLLFIVVIIQNNNNNSHNNSESLEADRIDKPDRLKKIKNKANEFIRKDILRLIFEYSIYILLIISIAYASYQLIINELFFKLKSSDFNILSFSEHIFLFFLPIFILLGFLKYFKFDLKRFLIFSDNEPSLLAQEQLYLSKKLFFSSILSYLVLKITEILFEDRIENVMQIIAIGIFFFMIISFILIQQYYKNRSSSSS